MSQTFAFGAGLLIIIYIPVLINAFKQNTLFRRQRLIVSLRYSLVSVMVGFAAGIWMIVVLGDTIGVSGNIIVLHGLAFHSLQSLILLAWLHERIPKSKESDHFIHHLAGSSWLITIILVAIVTSMGETIFQWSLLSGSILFFLSIWSILFARVFIKNILIYRKIR